MLKKAFKALLLRWQLFTLFLTLLLVGFIIIRRTIFKPQPEYITAEAIIRDISQTLEVSGQIKAEVQANLKFQTIGKLAWVGIQEGDKVNKWQPVASLDKTILKKKLKKLLSDYQHQRWDFDQIREDNLVTTDNYDDYSFSNTVERLIEQEQFLLDKTVTDVEIQTLTNKLAVLVSPIDGIVTSIDTPVAGVNVLTTDAIKIVDPQSLYFAVEIDESDIGAVSVGQSAQITLEAFPNQPISSTITWVDFAASTSDSGGTVFIAKLNLPDIAAVIYRLGMSGDAVITIDTVKKALTVPIEAVTEKADGSLIIKVLHGSQIEEKTVVTGIETDTDIQIINGLDQGDQVLTGEKK